MLFLDVSGYNELTSFLKEHSHFYSVAFGAIHKRRRQFGGGGGGTKLTIWGDMRGVGVKENTISSIQDW